VRIRIILCGHFRIAATSSAPCSSVMILRIILCAVNVNIMSVSELMSLWVVGHAAIFSGRACTPCFNNCSVALFVGLGRFFDFSYTKRILFLLEHFRVSQDVCVCVCLRKTEINYTNQNLIQPGINVCYGQALLIFDIDL